MMCDHINILTQYGEFVCCPFGSFLRRKLPIWQVNRGLETVRLERTLLALCEEVRDCSLVKTAQECKNRDHTHFVRSQHLHLLQVQV